MTKAIIFGSLALVAVTVAACLYFIPADSEFLIVRDNSLKNTYNQWKLDFGVNVGASEDNFRFAVWKGNYADIQKHNRLLGRGYNKGLNAFTHLTPEEFSATHLGFKMPANFSRQPSAEYVSVPMPAAGKSVDWTSKMNAVKNQGQCGSCWAFSTVGAVEGANSVLKGKLYDLSEQELVDCSDSFGNEGCNGGLMDQGFEYVASVKGLSTEKAYPYTATDGTCKTVKQRFGAISGHTDVTVNSRASLMAALDKQPVSVAIEADMSVFQSYTSGVITSTSCGTSLDHGVVAVGYNTQGQTGYYIVRNSWGASWGEKGYVRIAIQNKDGAGICGIQMAASYPTL